MAKKQLEHTPSWLPRDEESASAYAAFVIYRDLGIGRKLAQVERICATMPHGGMDYQTIHSWAHKFGWEQRILDHDASMAREVANAELVERKKSVRQIQKERIDRIRLNLAVADQLRMRGLEMLDYPLFRKTEESQPVVGPDGKTTIITKVYEPTKWTPKDAVACIKAAAEIEKVSLFDTSSSDVEADDERLNVAGDQIAGWRQAQMKKIADIPTNPPGTLTNPIDVSDHETADEDAA